MSEVSHHIQAAQDALTEAISSVRNGETLSNAEVFFLTELSKQIRNLRAESIRAEFKCGLKQHEIAKRYDVTPARISQIINGD